MQIHFETGRTIRLDQDRLVEVQTFSLSPRAVSPERAIRVYLDSKFYNVPKSADLRMEQLPEGRQRFTLVPNLNNITNQVYLVLDGFYDIPVFAPPMRVDTSESTAEILKVVEDERGGLLGQAFLAKVEPGKYVASSWFTEDDKYKRRTIANAFGELRNYTLNETEWNKLKQGRLYRNRNKEGVLGVLDHLFKTDFES